jgi:hypothetical protein
MTDHQLQPPNTFDYLKKRITILNERSWEGRINQNIIDDWLGNFDGRSGLPVETEQLHALYLLAQFMYFGSREIRVLLRSIYNDLFLAPLVQEVRCNLGSTREQTAITDGVINELQRTRFLGVGNPSESGAHLLYYFRQENRLSKGFFLDTAQILKRDPQQGKRELRYPIVERYVFVDDVCGSGETAIRYSTDFLTEITALNPNIKAYYFCLFATAEGMQRVREHSIFKENCGAIFELDKTYSCLDESSRYFQTCPNDISREIARQVALSYGTLLWPSHPLGYENSQMLLGFPHNTPDNTLPMIWMERENGASIQWTPAFRRYPKG